MNKRILLVVASALMVTATACTKNDSNKDASVENTIQSQEVSSEQKKEVGPKEAEALVREYTNSDTWNYAYLSTFKDINYHTVENSDSGEEVRYHVMVDTGDLYVESVLDLGNIMPVDEDNRNSTSQYITKDASLIKSIQSKLKTLEGTEEVTSKTATWIKKIFKDNGKEVSIASSDNKFIKLSDSYKKYSKDYMENFEYNLNQNYDEGITLLTFEASQEGHIEDRLTNENKFIVILHQVYTNITGDKIALNKFISLLQDRVDSDGGDVLFNTVYNNVDFSVDTDGATRTIKFKAEFKIENTLKRKEYKKTYETVDNYLNDSKEISTKASEIQQEFMNKTGYTISNNTIRNIDEPIEFSFEFVKDNFLQNGNIRVYVVNSDFTTKAPKLSQKNLDKALSYLKLSLGEELYKKIDKSQLNLDIINKALETEHNALLVDESNTDSYESQTKLYMDNGEISIYPLWQDFDRSNKEDKAILMAVDIFFKVPVIAEGITQI